MNLNVENISEEELKQLDEILNSDDLPNLEWLELPYEIIEDNP